MKNINRRQFLTGTGFGFLAMLAGSGLAFSKVQAIGDPLKDYAYRGWEDLYKKEWTWDRVQYATHSVGCVGKCSWKVYSKGGIPLREEQTATYPLYSSIPRGNTPGSVWERTGVRL